MIRSMKNLLVLSFVVLMLTASCQDVDIIKNIEEYYEHSLQCYKSDLVNHFPSQLPDSCTFVGEVLEKTDPTISGFSCDEMLLWKAYSKDQYKKISTQFKNLPGTIYSANDSSLLLVFSYCDIIEIDGKTYDNLEPQERQVLVKHNVTVASSYPIPLFEIDEYKGSTMSGLTEDFKIYVFEAKSGKFLNKEYLRGCECLPSKWKHGYSKGVSLSDEKQVVIYWVVVW